MSKRPLEYFSILYIVIWTISPPLQLSLTYRILVLGCAGLLFCLNNFSMTEQHWYAMIFCVLIAIIEVFARGRLSAALTPIATYLLFLGYVINSWYENEWSDFETIIPVVLVLLAFWNFKTVSALANDSSVARLVVRNDETANSFLRQGVGGYGLMYCQVIIVPAILKWVLSVWKHNKVYFLCGAIWAVSFFSYLAEAGYSIAVVASFIGVIILFAYRRQKVVPALIVSFVVLVILVYLIGYNETVRNALLEVFDGTKVASKIRDITSTVTTDETADSIAARIVAYETSLQSFFIDYPLIGGLWRGGAGGHSALLDSFAKYGIIGGILMFQMIFFVPRAWKRKTRSAAVVRTINATIVTIAFVTLLDSMPYNLVMMLTVVLPIILSSLERWSTDNEHFMDSQSFAR